MKVYENGLSVIRFQDITVVPSKYRGKSSTGQFLPEGGLSIPLLGYGTRLPFYFYMDLTAAAIFQAVLPGFTATAMPLAGIARTIFRKEEVSPRHRVT